MPSQVSEQPNVYTIDVSGPANDKILDVAAYERYLLDRIKVQGRTGNLSDRVTVTKNGNVLTITIAPGVQFAKRYVKYLTKKFLKKNELRDFLRVVANGKQSYELRYFNIEGQDEEDEEDDE
ncbi:60S ribosomal protein L22 [Gorgonomyces haynaldii]|nr:60S ribosomal protein L22 [Gorgonomyces haynaldii]